MSDSLDDDSDEGILDQFTVPVNLEAEINRRCRGTKIEATKQKDLDGDEFIELKIPAGRASVPIYLRTTERIEEILSVEFEMYSVSEKHSAIFSSEVGVIEIAVRPIAAGIAFFLQRQC